MKTIKLPFPLDIYYAEKHPVTGVPSLFKMGAIGEPQRRVEIEPMPESAPVEAPAEPVHEPEPVPA